jgi:uncharacterized protein (DUF427 family)
MTLSLGTGPLGTQPAGDFNFSLDDAPAHRLYFEPYPRRVRALVGDRVVLDSVRGRLLHESNHLPRLYVPLADLDHSLLQRTETSTHCPFKGDASYFTIAAGDRMVEDAVWTYEQPIESAAWLGGFACLYWEKADAWFVEGERVYGKLRDPYHRVDVFEASRPVRVTADGELVAESARAKLLYETGLPPMAYVPGADIVAGALAPAEKTTVCPYKGEASYWHVQVDGRRIEDGAWSYETPLAEALEIARHVCFAGDGIEVEIAEPADRFTLTAPVAA